jgi:hypothetical protein
MDCGPVGGWLVVRGLAAGMACDLVSRRLAVRSAGWPTYLAGQYFRIRRDATISIADNHSQ